MAHILSNGIITVEIAEVGEYRQSRFDWTGWITQVTLEQGQHTFCVPESLIPGHGSGGLGLCNEFGISRAIGYETAKPGEWFPKPGVGLLQRPNNGPYDFFKPYEIEPFTVTSTKDSNQIVYNVQGADSGGYRIQLRKAIAIDKNTLTISYELENQGTEPFETEEYVHNFIGINGAQTSGDYELRFAEELVIEETESDYTAQLLQAEGKTISWNSIPIQPYYCRISGWEEPRAMNWELIHKPSGAGVSESGDFPVSKIALWGESHVISPEVFVNISLLPRQSKRWARSYRFFAAE
ncbi:hypothetical protein [Paenibacillus donghaensis]|uniref:Uncharacterized protein n=1 Tax=Paenibacillus donghaensis TaxID=414771 RepID=A0A2Z2KAW3_9BACL|nr:hypothetical protein [Paenibacillus donghaensis]ASA20070.1 hypothetical protein B9T62_04225 [Paenibacillus donghaensis]